MANKSMKITVKAPRGLKTNDPIVLKAQKAAQAVIDEASDLADTVKVLQSKGINMTLSELLSLRNTSGKKVATPTATGKGKGKGKRTVLTPAQKSQVEARLKSGATANAVAKEFGVSSATVNNIKRSAGLTKPRG